MKSKLVLTGAVFSGLSVVFGAFGAHILKSKIGEAALASFETAVRYQMYHGLVLILLAILPFAVAQIRWVYRSFLWGTILFSGSIYLLALDELFNVSVSFLGPVTPLGGLFLIVGWTFLVVRSFKAKW